MAYRRLGWYGANYGAFGTDQADPLAAAILGALSTGTQMFGMVRGMRQENADRKSDAARALAEAERRQMLDQRDEDRYNLERQEAVIAESRADRREKEREKATTQRENAKYLRDRGISAVPTGFGGTTYAKVAQTDDELAAAVTERQALDLLRQQAKALGIPNAESMTRGELTVLAGEAAATRKSDAEFKDFQRRENYQEGLVRGRGTAGAGGAGASRAGVVPGDNKDEMPLRKEFNAEIQRHTQIAPALAKIEESAKLGTGQGDMGIIYGFMRMQDPGSTVREGEYATAQNSAGVPDQVRQIYNKALTGEKLVPDVRRSFVDAARKLAQTERDAARQTITRYAGLSVRYGIPADAIVYDPYDAVLGPYQTGKRRPLDQVVGGTR